MCHVKLKNSELTSRLRICSYLHSGKSPDSGAPDPWLYLVAVLPWASYRTFSEPVYSSEKEKSEGGFMRIKWVKYVKCFEHSLAHG